MRDKINYSDIMDLGFKEEFINDENYFNEHGFQYAIITKNLTKKIYLDWCKDTKLCNLIRINSPKKCDIKAEVIVNNLVQLKAIIDFYSDEVEEPCYNYLA